MHGKLKTRSTGLFSTGTTWLLPNSGNSLVSICSLELLRNPQSKSTGRGAVVFALRSLEKPWAETDSRIFYAVSIFVIMTKKKQKSHDRLWKFGNFMTKLMRNFENSINPGEFICVDESLLAFKGRLAFKQYNPLKRSRFGIKYFAIVDCETKFLVKIIVDLGKSSRTEVPLISEYGLGGSTVLKLLENLFWKNHKLVINNWFNSPKLQEYLVLKKTFCLGTVRQSRKLMPKFKTKLKEGEVEVYTSGHLVLERWRDRREVVMLNTFCPSWNAIQRFEESSK